MKDITLPSGVVLRIGQTPFAISKALYVAFMAEAKGLKLDMNAQVDFNLLKDMFCTAFSSSAIDACLEKCLERCLYDGKKITSETFEPEATREDYLSVCYEVAYANLLPFSKNLTSQFNRMLTLINDSLKSK